MTARPAILALLLLLGCTTFRPVKDQAVRHLLEPLAPDRSLAASTPAIAIGRVALPEYLDDEHLVTRRDGVLEISGLDQWAEPLDTSVARVIAANLSRSTGSMNIQPVGRFTSLDYTHLLELRISRFDPDESGALLLQGTWRLQPVSGGEARNRFFRILAPIQEPVSDAKNRVKAMNQALLQLSREIAASR